MDMKIAGKRALVCASSKGLGRGCAVALAAEGVDLILNARTKAPLEETAETIRNTYGVDVITVVADITSPEGQAAVLAVAGDVDILVTNAGGPPPGLWSDWDREDFIKALDANMLAPITLIKAVLPQMMAKGWGRIVNITSKSVKAPIAVLGLSNSARAGLTGYVAGTSRQVAGSGVTINNLLPGMHETARTVSLSQTRAKQAGITFEQAQKESAAAIPAGRYGTTEEFGATCAFLCSQYAGYIVGQNILLDGGDANLTM